MSDFESKEKFVELIDQAYQRGFKAGQENALKVDSDKFREQGRNEAWETVKKIYFPINNGGLTGGEIDKIFDVASLNDILEKFSASEAVEKLHAYEEKKKQEVDEIRVGDEVILNENVISNYKPNTKAVVIRIDCRSKCSYNVMFANGDTEWIEKDEVRKTGKHFSEIADVMFYMKI